MQIWILILFNALTELQVVVSDPKTNLTMILQRYKDSIKQSKIYDDCVNDV